MSSSCRSRRLHRALAALAAIAAVTLGPAGSAEATTAGRATPLNGSLTTAADKKKSTVPEAQSWVGGKNLISTKEQLDLPDGVPDPPVPDSTSWLIADLDTREILAAKNVHVPLAPASTLKIFTSLAIAPELDADQVYTGRTADEEIDGTRVGIVAGSKYTVNDLLHGLLMSSGNDCANALANLVGGMSSATELMRQEAQELGAFDTVVHNTSGLDAKGQVTSAYDLALAGSAILQNKQLAKILVTESYSFPAEGTSLGSSRKTFSTQNHNGLLGYLDGVTGIKNGYTTSALASDVASATHNGHSYIAVVMRTESSVFTQAGDLLTWAFDYGQKADPVGTLVEPGELSAMTGPNVVATTDPADTDTDTAAGDDDADTAQTQVAGGSGSGGLQAALSSGAGAVEHGMIRFWPLLAVVVLLLMLGGFFVLRPVLAGGRAPSRSRRGSPPPRSPDPRYTRPADPRYARPADDQRDPRYPRSPDEQRDPRYPRSPDEHLDPRYPRPPDDHRAAPYPPPDDSRGGLYRAPRPDGRAEADDRGHQDEIRSHAPGYYRRDETPDRAPGYDGHGEGGDDESGYDYRGGRRSDDSGHDRHRDRTRGHEPGYATAATEDAWDRPDRSGSPDRTRQPDDSAPYRTRAQTRSAQTRSAENADAAHRSADGTGPYRTRAQARRAENDAARSDSPYRSDDSGPYRTRAEIRRAENNATRSERTYLPGSGRDPENYRPANGYGTTSDREAPGYDEPRRDRTGYDLTGYDPPTHEAPGYEAPRYEAPGPGGSTPQPSSGQRRRRRRESRPDL